MTARPAPDPLFILRRHEADVQAVAFHPTAARLYSGDALGEVIVWDLNSRRPTATRSLHLPAAGILCLHVLATSTESLLSQGRDGELKFWYLDSEGCPSEKPHVVLQTFAYSFCRCAVFLGLAWPLQEEASADDAEIRSVAAVALAGSEAKDVELWTLEDAKLARTFGQDAAGLKHGALMAVAFAAGEGGFPGILAGYEDGSVALWSIGEWRRPAAVVTAHGEPLMALDACGHVAFSAAADDQLCKLALSQGAGLAVARRARLPRAGTASVAMRRDARIVALGAEDGAIRVFSIKSCKPLAILQYHRASIADIQFDERTGRLAAGSRDRSISLWEVYTKQ